MDLIENDEIPLVLPPEILRILQLPAYRRQLAVKVLGAWHRLAQRRLADPAHPRKPTDLPPGQGTSQPALPEMAGNHITN